MDGGRESFQRFRVFIAGSLDVDKEFLALALLNEYVITYCLVCLSGVLSNSEVSTKK